MAAAPPPVPTVVAERRPALDRLVIVTPSPLLAAGVRSGVSFLPADRVRVRGGCLAVDVLQSRPLGGRPSELRSVALIDAQHLATRMVGGECRCIETLAACGYAVVVLGAHPQGRLAALALSRGADLVLDAQTSPEQLVAALREAVAERRGRRRVRGRSAHGIPELTPQELAALTGYGEGRTLHSVARQMGVQPDTARTYLARVRRKYRLVDRPISSRVDYFIRAVQDGYLALPQD